MSRSFRRPESGTASDAPQPKLLMSQPYHKGTASDAPQPKLLMSQPYHKGTMTGPGCPIADRLPEHSGPAHSVDELP